MPPSLKSIDHVHVYVANRDAAKAWYAEVLGLLPVAELAFWADDGGPLTLADAEGAVHIALFESAPLKCRSTIALGVGAAEFLAWKQHLSEKLEAPLEAEDHDVSWSLYFTDPDGNPYEITTYEYAAVAAGLRVPAHLIAFWSDYSTRVGGLSGERFFEAFSFGDSPQMADELGALVVSGVKRAMASALWSYQASGKALPKPGQLSIVTNSADRPLCIIETVQVVTVPFSEVTAEFAAAEGEGDGSLAFWRQAHQAFFSRECQGIGKTFGESMPVVCEHFQVVFIPGDN